MTSTRYSRQERLPEVGPCGQKALQDSKVLIVGLGGLGCPAASYLASAGVGTLGLVDGDFVDQTNLHRQLLYSDQDLGLPKVSIAGRRLRTLSPSAVINEYFEPLNWTNAATVLGQYDVILDCTDNFETKYLLNDICLQLKKPLVAASATGFEAYLMVISKDGPCLRCLYPNATAADVGSCNLTGVLGAVVGIIGSWQATEALKLILIQNHEKQMALTRGLTEHPWFSLTPPQGQVLFFDFTTSQVRTVHLQKNTSCLCARKADAHINSDQEIIEHQKTPKESLYLTLDQVRKLNQYVLVDVRSEQEREEEVFSAATQGLNPETEIIHRPFSEIVGSDFDQDQWPQNTAYVLYCRLGKRSILAAQWLRDHGVPQTYGLRS
ncbi:MAG: ThiF family adenylyltransferase [Bdellovibrionaceae bacterium]|nr:ThiF family adenylyltransferase [Pseudobdellovibrionaceae bacterium]